MKEKEEMEMKPVQKEPDDHIPEWLFKEKVNEVKFCQELLSETPMVCCKGSFFNVDGRVSDERTLKKQIYEKLKPWVKQGLPKKVDSLLEVLRAEAHLD